MKSTKRFTALLVTIFLICSPACSQTSAPAVDVISVRAGWIAPRAGYFLTETALRDTVTGWATARKEADIREQALTALRDEIAAQQKDLKNQLAALQSEITAERRLWRSRVRRGKIQGITIGVLAGFAGGYLVRRNNP